MNKIYGVVIGTVTDLKDPKNLGRVKVQFPWLSGKSKPSDENSIQEDTKNNESYWTRIATTMTGANRGTWFMPEIDDEVLVAFEHGDPDHPYIVGFLWNGQDKPPRTDPKKRLIRSLNGHEIELYDPEVNLGDRGYIRLKDAHGNLIELANGRITVSSKSGVEIAAPSVVINGRPVALTAPGTPI